MEIKEYAGKYNEITGKLLESLLKTKKGENIVLSPMSVIMLLGIAADAVDGKTRDEIVRVLCDGSSYEDCLDVLKEIRETSASSGSLMSSNAICVKKSIVASITDGYEERLKANYDGKLFSSNNIVRDVNAWVNEKTKGMIKEAVSDSMNQMLTCLMNAIAFDFEEQYSQNGDVLHTFLLLRNRKQPTYRKVFYSPKKYPRAGYGQRFFFWLGKKNPQPYGSWGNGSAMRVSSVGWLYNSLEETRRYARLTAEVTHNHPEGIKGAEAVASAIFMARNGASKEEIKKYIIQEFDYDLSRTCDEIRPGYHHIESCQETVPEALTAFMEGTDFEDVVRTAVSLGGDCDTLTCIAASIAEAFYGLPDNMRGECRKRLPKDMLGILDRFDERRGDRR